ncbi:hypothetical protein ACOTCJ_12245 [Achromobacter xylosoxidans]|uniref:hypothetical protein n=1 Tax=Alcaligenes xylosoxydans xylosoxydans TaxID=85698 RepID=UPI001301092A|nr:hypothetical protein [Achromobacter xylosoxidans]
MKKKQDKLLSIRLDEETKDSFKETSNKLSLSMSEYIKVIHFIAKANLEKINTKQK